MKYKPQILILLNRAHEEVSDIINVYELTSDCYQLSTKIQSVLGLMRIADILLIKHHLESCVPQLLVKRKADEGIKQIMLSYKYLQRIKGDV